MAWIAIFLGGGLGSLARYGISRAMSGMAWDFAWATMTANLISSFVLGCFIVFFTKEQEHLRLFWMVGFCGGFSTFSTFTAETFSYLQGGNYLYALLNVLGSILVCLVGLGIGIRIMS